MELFCKAPSAHNNMFASWPKDEKNFSTFILERSVSGTGRGFKPGHEANTGVAANADIGLKSKVGLDSSYKRKFV